MLLPSENLTDVQRKMIEVIKNHNTISQTDLMSALGISQQRISYNIRMLRKLNIVSTKMKGFRSYCSVNPDYLAEMDIPDTSSADMEIYAVCSTCNHVLMKEAKFCDQCGKKIMK